jgi:hypothetical protein
MSCRENEVDSPIPFNPRSLNWQISMGSKEFCWRRNLWALKLVQKYTSLLVTAKFGPTVMATGLKSVGIY